jgi:hypothetical protein
MDPSPKLFQLLEGSKGYFEEGVTSKVRGAKSVRVIDEPPPLPRLSSHTRRPDPEHCAHGRAGRCVVNVDARTLMLIIPAWMLVLV